MRAGRLLAAHDYDPFGVPRSNISTPFGYTGQQWDGGVGLLYLRARYYDPQLGRFLSRDPFPGLLTIPQSLHPYAYVFNNPATLRDPSGHFAPILLALIIGGVAGGGFAAWGYMQAHPCADFWSDPAFQQAVGVGILGGMAGGAAGLGAGIALGFFIPSSTLAGAIVLGAAMGAIGGGAAQATANVLTRQTLSAGLTEAVMVGAVAGGVGGALGHGIGRAWVGLRGSASASSTVQAPPKIVYC
jgi:RHS repeat-associated protein